MHYTKEEAFNLHVKAVRYGLSGRELLRDTEAVMRQCNGIGAEWMPDSLTVLCTKLSPVMAVPAAIHDRRYHLKDIDRLAADTEFLSNVMRMIELTYAWYDPRRYTMRKRAARYYTYLRAFGGRAWEEAGEK